MLDILKLKLTTKFMKGFVSKIVSNKINKKLGCKMNIDFKDIDLETNNNDVYIHISGDIKISRTELERLLEKIN